MAAPTKPIDVACAVIQRADGRILAARRPRGKHLGGKWEFPGGKLEPGEASGSALEREIHEELATTIRLVGALPVVEHQYPGFTIRLHPWLCELTGPEPVPAEHSEIRWLDRAALQALDWAAADLPVLHALGHKV
jgi:8-oxo-dGTP diphosphatase